MDKFDFNFTEDILKNILKGNQDVHAWYDSCLELFPEYLINTKLRVAHFFAQTCHESNNFMILEECLKYSSEGLMKTFPKYFPNVTIANQYARDEKKIANRVYANRMGNGDEKSGDGYTFRGRGLIQVTGKSNYQQYARDTGQSLENAVDHLCHPHGGLESACWYWHTRGLNSLADSNNILSITRKINGGTIGLEDRTSKYNKYIKLFI